MGRQGDRRPAGLRSPYLGHEQPGPGRPGGGKSPQNRLCARHDDSFFHSSYPAGNADGRTVEIPDRAGHRAGLLGLFHFLRPSLPVPRMESGGNSQIRAEGSRAVAVLPSGRHGCGTMPESVVMVPRGRLPTHSAQIAVSPAMKRIFPVKPAFGRKKWDLHT